MSNKFKADDKVVVSEPAHSQAGVQGRIHKVYVSDDTYLVELETGRVSGFFESELELVDPQREALIRLAETLDLARQQANAIKVTEGDTYRTISEALYSTLEAYFHQTGEGVDTYNEIIRSGFSVREAVKHIEASK